MNKPEPCWGLGQLEKCYGFTRPDHCAEWSWIECRRCEVENCKGCEKWRLTLFMLESMLRSRLKKR